ncbi:MAG: M14 family metallopeptidase [Burkholderiaceae bacterium]
MIAWRSLLAALLFCAAAAHAQNKLALEQRFADLPIAIDTPAFAPGKRDFTSDAELFSFITRLDAQDSGQLSWRVIGKTPGGRDLHLLILTADGKGAPHEIATSRKPVVWILGLQHGNEPAGGEAALEIARRLSRGELRGLLERITVVIAPRMNPDGAAVMRREAATLDLNRDHLDLASVENQALRRWMRTIPPHVVVDLHEFTVGGRWIERFAAVQASDVLIQAASHPEVADPLRQLVREVFDPALDAAFKRNNLKSFVYHTLSPAQDKAVVQTGSNFPGIARNAFGLYGAVSYLIETRGIGLGRDYFQRRVGSHVIAVSAILRTAAQNTELLKKAVAQARNDWAGDITIDYASRRETRDIPMLDAVTGEERAVKVDFQNSLIVTPLLRRPIPVGYLLSAEQEAAAQRLANHGVRVIRLARGVDVNVERYIVRGIRQEQGDGGTQLDRVNADTQLTTLPFPAGSYYVSLEQPMARIAAVMIEPESQGSLLAVRLIKSASPIAAGLELPLWRVMTPTDFAGPLIEAQ